MIAVAGPPGSGKSTLARALAERLGHAPILSYDDYETMTARPPAEMQAWLARGAPIAEIALPGFAEDLGRLRAGEAVPARGPAPARRPGAFVVLDTLVGRAHPAVAGSVDLLVWIEVPLDVALARKVRRVIADSGMRDPRALLGWLDGYLGHYAGFIRASYLLQRSRIEPGADIVLDGLRPAADLAEAAEAEVRRRWPDQGGRSGRP